VSANDVGKAAILFYLLAYAITNLGAFAVIALVATADRPNDELRDFTGLWYTRPALAALMTVFLLSLGGFPPTVGFIAKWFVFSAAINAGYLSLAIIGVLTSVVSVFFYLRIVVMMYMAAPADARPMPLVSRASLAVLAASVVAILYLGILPTRVLDLATGSATSMYDVTVPPR
jgi:NADH-quinone oxidoreductase subunit N